MSKIGLQKPFNIAKGRYTFFNMSPHVKESRTVYWIPVFVSRTWILDSNLKWDSGFLELYSGLPKPRIPDSTSKSFPDSGIRIALHDGAKYGAQLRINQ